MKFWYHAIAATVGLAVAALIVYLVFGSASEQGAVQDGDAGALASAEGLCGSIAPADTRSPEARATAAESLPALFDDKGPLPAIADSRPDQQAWVARVHAAGGLCVDEVSILSEGTSVSLSTVEDVTEAQAAAYVAGVLEEAFTPPFNPRQVTIVANVGGTERTVVVSNRAWRAYQARRRQLGVEHSIANLALFRQAVGAQFGQGLRINGW